MNNLLNKVNAKTTFSNGYTASVVYFPENDEHEVAVMVGDRLVYDTPITEDVVRCETSQQAWDVVGQIMMLPERGKNETVS
ncbi:MAG: hypothetical protein DWQ49_06600 [Bacteroidetes bacterium]|nr:MAG: hypothetical protein DWQ49_06600 [Bacteroidota bacterium]